MLVPRRAALVAALSAVLALGVPGSSTVAGADSADAHLADVYVSPMGDDHAQGIARHPVKTLQRARDLARARAAHADGDLTVHLASGTYRTEKPLVLDARDSGRDGHRIIWQGTGSTVISGGRKVEGWKPVHGRPGLYSAPAPQGLTDTRQLYVDGVRAQRARGEVPVGLTATPTGYTTTADTLARWRHPSDAEFVYSSGEELWNVERNGLGQWTEPRCRIAEAEGTTLTMVQPCWDNSNKRVEFPGIPGRSVSMVGPGRLTNGGRASYIENAYELLDQPGEWYLDRWARTVYYLPRKGEDLRRADVEAASAEKLVDGRGTATDYRDTLGNNDPTLVKDNWWEEGTSDGDNKGLVTTGNHIMTSLADAPAAIVDNAGVEPAYRGILTRRTGALSVPEAPSRVGTSTVGAGALYATFNPSFVEGGSPVLGYTAHALRLDGTEVAASTASAADYKRLAYIRIGGLPKDDGPFTVIVTAANAQGTSAPSLASAPLLPTAATVPADAPTGPKLRTAAHAATVAWTPPVKTVTPR
ncbi:hypothetical protein ACFRCI_13395 [Streptomyces sp. NPDC056638]|uniref:hypothetical protein n=1 Tax=Streptomyces sp. NPDC056638 TaxID=3345887 RepID=UPI0036B74317